ncbi:MAG: 3-dehydroquinate synthase [Lysobacterales bacterium]|jgi:3-dehydroquinate synthase
MKQRKIFMPSIEVDLGERSYPVHIESGALGQSAQWCSLIASRRVLVISNETVASLYLQTLLDSLEGMSVEALILEDGEASKSITNWSRIIDRLVDMKASRDICLIALGGGVVGDICGFAAASYMRGVPFIQIPTTLLAQVDASVGGKTAVNHPMGKNLIGAFHQPKAVIIDTRTLETLPEREFNAGLAEVVKYGAICDADFFYWLKSNADKIRARETETIIRLIEFSVRNKAQVVAEDELESGSRALLNFGHTFAHALETIGEYSQLLHGEAVSIGMVVASRLSESRGLCAPGVSSRISSLLSTFGLPISLPENSQIDTIIDAMALDKKMLAGQTRLILLEALGSAVIDSGSSHEQIRSALEQCR